MSGRSLRFYGWQVVVASIVGAALSPATLVNVPFSLFISALESEFHWTRPTITAALSVFLAFLVVSLPLAGRLVDRFGARRIALPSILAYGVVLASVAWVDPSPSQFYLRYGLIAVLGAGAQSLTFIRVLTAWFDRRRGLAIGACMAGYGIGYVVVPLITHALISRYGWRVAYCGLGALAVIGALPIVTWLLRDSPKPQRRAMDRGTDQSRAAVMADASGTFSALKRRELWLMCLAFVLMSAALNAVQAQMVPLLTDRGIAVGTAALMLSAIGIGSFPGRLLVGFLLDRMFAPHVAVCFFAISAFALLWLAATSTPAGIALCAVAVGVGLGAENDVLGYLTGRYFDLRRFGQLYGLLLGAYLLGAASGPYLMARFYASAGSYNGALRLGAVTIAVACALLLCLPRYGRGGMPSANAD